MSTCGNNSILKCIVSYSWLYLIQDSTILLSCGNRLSSIRLGEKVLSTTKGYELFESFARSVLYLSISASAVNLQATLTNKLRGVDSFVSGYKGPIFTSRVLTRGIPSFFGHKSLDSTRISRFLASSFLTFPSTHHDLFTRGSPVLENSWHHSGNYMRFASILGIFELMQILFSEAK